MTETRIGVIGCAGRVGRMLVADIVATDGCVLAGGVVRPGSPAMGQDLGELAGVGHFGIDVGDNAEHLLRDCAVAIEFTTPAATAEHAALAARLGTPLVIGTTGLKGEEERAVREAATRVPIVWAANTSLGINLLLGLVDQVARRLGADWDLEIMEMHHRGKVDAPSGTALALGRAAAAARAVDFDAVATRGRDGITGPRPQGAIGFAALRRLVEVDPARRRRGPAEGKCRAGRGIDLGAMVHLEDFDVPLRPEPAGHLIDQPKQQIDAKAGVGRPDDRHARSSLAHRPFLGRLQPGRADDQRLAEPRRHCGVFSGGSRGGELDRHIAVAQEAVRAVADDDPDAAEASQLADILAGRRAAMPRHAASQGAALGREDVADQHAAHAAGASDHTDPGFRHGRLPIRVFGTDIASLLRCPQ